MRKTAPRAHSFRVLLGQNIRAARKARGLRLIQVAAHTGFSISKVSRIEHGAPYTGYADLCAIAAALGVSVRGLLPSGVTVAKAPRLHFEDEA